MKENLFMVRDLSFEEFKSSLVEAVKNMAAEKHMDVVIKETEIKKVNDNEMAAITIGMPDSNVAVTQYPGLYYEGFQDKTVMDAAREVLARYEVGQRELPSFDLSQINPEDAKDHLYLQVVNAAKNEGLAATCAHIKCNDLIAVPRWRLDIGGADDSASFVVGHDAQSMMLHMTDSELLAMAKANTEREYSFKGMSQVMREMMGDDIMPEMEMMLQDDMMYVLHAQDKSFGASVIVSPNVLKEVQEKIGEEFYIIPSSRFEVLCIPVSKVSDPADLHVMCMEVNESEVRPDEQLSDNIYRYDGQKLTICNSLEDLKKLQSEAVKDVVDHKIKM